MTIFLRSTRSATRPAQGPTSKVGKLLNPAAVAEKHGGACKGPDQPAQSYQLKPDRHVVEDVADPQKAEVPTLEG